MDFFDSLGDFGAAGNGWRSPLAIAGLVIGAGVGGYLGYAADGILAALAGVGTGALVGWWLGVMLRGVAFFLMILAVSLVAVFGWRWLMGGA